MLFSEERPRDAKATQPSQARMLPRSDCGRRGDRHYSDARPQDVDSLFAVGYSLGRSETLKKFHSHVLPLSGEKA